MTFSHAAFAARHPVKPDGQLCEVEVVDEVADLAQDAAAALEWVVVPMSRRQQPGVHPVVDHQGFADRGQEPAKPRRHRRKAAVEPDREQPAGSSQGLKDVEDRTHG
jgi:hypothetical protein